MKIQPLAIVAAAALLIAGIAAGVLAATGQDTTDSAVEDELTFDAYGGSRSITHAGDFDVILEPTSKDFGVQAVGGRTPASRFQVRLAGTFIEGEDPYVLASALASGKNDFEVNSDLCGDPRLPKFDCVVTVVFAPKSAGPKSAALYVVVSTRHRDISRSRHGSASVPLTGTGT